MTEITFFELHLDDATFNAPFSAAESPEEIAGSSGGGLLSRGGTDDEEAGATAGEGGGPSALPVLLGLVVLALALVGVRRFVGGEPERVPE